jgi:2-furoyl-CoA dehydrogenase large subunit
LRRHDQSDIVHGMTYGGIAHGIGAALYEHFTYDDNGQLTSGTFMDYLIPSALEVPPIRIVDHCTPSPLTTFGQKGSGEAGYLGAPAAVANAVNDALAPLGVEINTLPISHLAIWEALSGQRKMTNEPSGSGMLDLVGSHHPPFVPPAR